MIKKQKIISIVSVISMSALVIFFQNCSKSGLKTMQGSLSSASTSCPGKVSALPVEKASSEFSEPEKKLNLSDFKIPNSQTGFQKVSKGSITLSADTKITVSVSQECLSLRTTSEDSPLTENLKRNPRPKKFSDLTSYTLTLNSDMDLNELEAIANNDECVKTVSPDLEIKKYALPSDPYLTQQKHLSVIEYPATYDFYFTDTKKINSDTVIAIIDDGIDMDHHELKDLLWVNTAEKNGTTGVDDDNNGYIDDINGYDFATQKGDPSHKSSESDAAHSHGTHVAGLVTAATNNYNGISGLMAKNSKLMILNIFGTNQTTSSAYIDASIRYAADMGAKIINISVGGKGSSAAIERGLRYAVSKGATVITASGNDGQELTASNVFSPASYASSIEGVVSVGATDANPGKVGTLCSFSNRSTTYVEIAAPGCDTTLASQGILSTIRVGKYGFLAGTSMASPVAAGTATVLYSYTRDAYNRILTPAEVESTLKAGSRNVASLNNSISGGKNVNLSDLKNQIVASYGSTTPPSNPNPNPNPPTPPEDPCKSN